MPTIVHPLLPPAAPIMVLISLKILGACFTEIPHFRRPIRIFSDVGFAFAIIKPSFCPDSENGVGVGLDGGAAVADFEIVA